ncbi:MAG: methyltransferase domain-containing protein [Hyphomonadaceae bacterium]
MSYSTETPGAGTYRPLFAPEVFEYVGLDVAAGPNVDVVCDSFIMEPFADQSFDLCVSGQTFEHNPFFWATFAEIARVLTPGGMALIIAPGGGQVHCTPYDCYRFYPDAWIGLCALTGLELVESYFESDQTAFVAPGGPWRDCAVIVRRPEMPADIEAEFYHKLKTIVAPLRGQGMNMGPSNGDKAPTRLGPAFGAYESAVYATFGDGKRKELAWKLQGRKKPRLFGRNAPAA